MGPPRRCLPAADERCPLSTAAAERRYGFDAASGLPCVATSCFASTLRRPASLRSLVR